MIPAEGRVGRQVSPGDESYPLVRQEKGAKGRAWPECCCRPYVRRCLLFDCLSCCLPESRQTWTPLWIQVSMP